MKSFPSVLRVALVEDDPDVREGLESMIGAEPGFECVRAVGSAEEALATFPALAIDIALMDINLPGMSGIDCIRLLKQDPALDGNAIHQACRLEDNVRL